MELGKLCDVVRGSSPRPQGDSRYYGGRIPRLMVSDLTRDGMFVTPQIDSLTEEGAKLSRPMKKGDVVVAVSGNPGLPAILNIDACIHDGFVGFRNLNTKLISNVFLYHFLKFNKEKTNSKAVGAIFKNLTTDQLKEIKVPLPDLKTQQKIAGILEQADAVRQKRKQASQLTEQLFQSAFNKMFGDLSTNEKSWKEKYFGEVCNFIRGPFGGSLKKEIFKENGYAVYEQAHAIYNQFSNIRYFIDEYKFKEMKRFELDPDDLIMSCSGTMGKVAIVPSNIKKGIINQALLKIIPSKQILSVFLKYWMESESFQNGLKLFSQGAAIQNVVSVKILKEIELPVPPLSLQQKFAEFIEKVERLRSKQIESEKELENLFNSLMQKYFGL